MNAVQVKRFLIVDDRPEDYKVITAEDLIRRVFEGAIVDKATDIKTALALTKAGEYDFILMDYFLEADKTGVDATIELRKAGVKTRIVAFTSEVERREVCVRFKAAGADAAINLPSLYQYLSAIKEGNDAQQYDSLRACEAGFGGR